MQILDALARLLGRPPAHEVVRHDLGWTPSLRRPRKPPKQQVAEEIAAFWTWWASVEDQLATIDRAPPSDAVLEGMDARLKAMHRDLAWELGPGVHTRHALTVSPDGVSALRSLTAAWKAAAPPSRDWEFFDVRPPVPGQAGALVLETAGGEVAGSDVQVAIFDDEDHHRLDVWVHHPTMKKVGKRQRWSLAFLLVDAALGEANVATWIRTITPSTVPLPDQKQLPNDVAVRDLDGLRARLSMRVAQGDPPPAALPQDGPFFDVDPRARRWRYPSFDLWMRVKGTARAVLDAVASVDGRVCVGVRQLKGSSAIFDLYTDDPSIATMLADHGVTVDVRWDPGWVLAGS